MSRLLAYHPVFELDSAIRLVEWVVIGLGNWKETWIESKLHSATSQVQTARNADQMTIRRRGER